MRSGSHFKFFAIPPLKAFFDFGLRSLNSDPFPFRAHKVRTPFLPFPLLLFFLPFRTLEYPKFFFLNYASSFGS